MPIDSSKFRSNSLTGTVRVTNGYANISLPTAFYALEGNINFNILVRSDGFSGTTLYTSPTVTLRDPSSVVSLTANTASVNEGDLVAFTLVTANVLGAANLYYSVFPVTANVTADDFVGNVGAFALTNNAGTFTLKANADVSLVDETGETFKVQLRTVSPIGNAVYTSSNVVILDTYKTYNILGFTAGSASPISGGDDVTFTFSATNVPFGTLFFYSTTGNVNSFTSNTGSFALNSLSNTFVISNPQVSVNSIYNVVLRTGSQSGPIVRTSNTMAVTYVPPQYLWAWGQNSKSQLGLGDTNNRSSPVQVGSLANWSILGDTLRSTLVVKTNGTLWGWGENGYGELGLGNTTSYSSPKQIGSLSNWATVSSGTYYSVGAIKTDGSLWTWGRNQNGVLGIGETGPVGRSSPVQVGSLYNWSSVSASTYHMAAVKTDGTLWTWGKNQYGRLGLGNTTYYSSPKQVGALTNWLSVSAGGYHNAAIKTDGTIWAWGSGDQGSLGQGNTTDRSSPTQVGSLTNWSSVSCGYLNTSAVKTDGTIWSWGYNEYGKLGLGNITSYSSPKQVGLLTNWLSVSAGYRQVTSIKTDGTLWIWGWNSSGQLGLEDTTNRSSPVQVGTLSNWLKVSAGQYSTVATASAPKPLNVLGVTAGNASPIISGTSVTYTVTATDVTLGTLLYYSTTGNVASFTSNTGSFALNGASNTFVISNPQVSVSSIYNVVVRTGSQSGNIVATSNTMVVNLPPPQYLWTWGYGTDGLLGLGNETTYVSPKQVGALTNWSSISIGAHATAIKNDGTLWSWGKNSSGALGLGDTTSRSSPVQVGALTTWSSVDVSDTYYNVAIKTDGTLWAWGYNGNGQLGQGGTTTTSSPVQIGALTNWLKASAGRYHQVAIKTGGTLWSWGKNNHGNLGLGNTTYYSSPKQIGSLTTWSSVSSSAGLHNLALATDGTMWAWGRNATGQLGVGDSTDRSSPVQVGALTTWSSAVVGIYNSSAIKTDGTLWAWGYNSYGQLGQNNTTVRSSPVQVGALTTWSSASIAMTAVAIKTDGTLWSWGMGSFSQLGLGDANNRSSPVQVGTLTNWLKVASRYRTMAIAGAPKSLTVTGVTAGTASPIVTGTDVTFTVTATDSTIGTLLYYSTTGNVASFTSNIGSIALNGASNTFIISNPQVSVSSVYNVVVRTGSQSGTVVATSNTMVVTPPLPQYLWGWGRNQYSELGVGDTANRSSPTQVGSLTTWSTGSTGKYTSSAIKTDGTLWTWGKNYSGGLGLGDTTSRSSPVQVGALTTWSIAKSGAMFGVAIKTDGTLWTWGRNEYGMLGLGDTTARSSPVQVGSLTNWLKVSAGQYSTAAIKTNGTLWTWGGNASVGGLGLGTIDNTSSPQQVGALTNWLTVESGSDHMIGLKTDGTLWSWGQNYFGNLGQGNTTNRSSPVQVGASTDWSSISTTNTNSAAIKNNGTLWMWGWNSAGALGLGDTARRSSPTQVGALTNWSTASTSFVAHQSHTTAIKTDGTLWSWGNNAYGTLGLGNTTSRSSPTQVGALTTWLKVTGGQYSTTAISN